MDVFSGDVRSGMPGLHGGGHERSRSLSVARPSWYPTMCSSRVAPGRRSGATCCATATSKPCSGWPPAYSMPTGSSPTCCSSSAGPAARRQPPGAVDLRPADQPALHPEGQFPGAPPPGRLRGLLQHRRPLSAGSGGDRAVRLVHRRRVGEPGQDQSGYFLAAGREPEIPRIYAPAISSKGVSGIPWLQVGSRSSKRLPLGSKKYNSRPVNTPRAR